MKKSKLLISLLTLGMVMGMSACGKEKVDIGYDNYQDWLSSLKGDKGDVGDTGASGTNGTNGTNGTTPTVTIGNNGNWFINGVDTGKKHKVKKAKPA